MHVRMYPSAHTPSPKKGKGGNHHHYSYLIDISYWREKQEGGGKVIRRSDKASKALIPPFPRANWLTFFLPFPFFFPILCCKRFPLSLTCCYTMWLWSNHISHHITRHKVKSIACRADCRSRVLAASEKVNRVNRTCAKEMSSWRGHERGKRGEKETKVQHTFTSKPESRIKTERASLTLI